MSNDSKEQKITLTEEQASRAAETIINAWLRGNEDNDYSNESLEKNKI